VGSAEAILQVVDGPQVRAGTELDETLERAKIQHTRAEMALQDGDASRAYELATAALETLTTSRTRYDMTHAQVTLSRAALASGRERQAIDHWSIARSSALAMGYGLLCLMYPHDVYDFGERITGALTAYACGDALGLPWEGTPKADIPADQIEQLPARKEWPRGVTSDDTALTLLAARHLADRDGGCDPTAFLAELAEQEPVIRGLGPTTKAAIEQFRNNDETAPSPKSTTNGAAMRALPIGWVLPHSQADRHRQVTIELSQITHRHPVALVAACVIATCASWALEGASPSLLQAVAADEAREATRTFGADERLAEMLTQILQETWTAPANGISLDPYETVAAVLQCIAQAPSLRDGLISTVKLGGDTDTVAALVGGLMGCRLTADQVRAGMPWYRLVKLPEPETVIAETAAALATARVVQST
jgi:ADP-ribosyl-[dinitrogen reductase] hydrolase